jgi:Na+-transporting NADH:ubiquinone oxidoreductase subunit A
LVGTHIHTLDPVDRNKSVWHLQAQDVLLIGLLFQTGKLWVGRLISLAGPAVEEPRLVLTRTGACLAELLHGDLADGEVRVVSGSVLSGQLAMGEETGFLGRYARQVTALFEGRERYFLGWLSPGLSKFSIVPTYLSKLFGLKRTFPLTTSTNGSHRAMVPIGSYERVFPLDILPTFLLRALSVEDVERAEVLGVLELEEEDLALCTVVCPGKEDWGAALRRNLTTIELEG